MKIPLFLLIALAPVATHALSITPMATTSRCASSTVSPRPTTRVSTRTVTKSLSFTLSVSRTVSKTPRPTTWMATRTVTRSTSRTLSQSQRATTHLRTRSVCPSSTPTVSLTRSITKTLAASWRNSGSRTPRATTPASTASKSVAPTQFPLACMATAGYYCMPVTFVVALCPAGVYGAVPGLTTPACSGSCTAAPGYFCPPGSTAPTATIICPVGAYCAGGGALNVSCYPVAACTVAGLSAQPPCYWNYTVLIQAGLNQPYGIAIESSSSLIIADQNNGVLKRVNTATLATTAVIGSGAYSSTDGPGLTATTMYPVGVVFSPTSAAYFWAEYSGHRIRKATQSFAVTTLAGSGTSSFADGTGTNADFAAPGQLALLSTGGIVVADSANNRIRLVTPAGVTTTIAGTGAPITANGVGTTSASFNTPFGVAVNSSDYIFVSEYSGCTIRMVTPSRVVSKVAGSTCGFLDSTLAASLFNALTQLAITPFNDLIVADQTGVRFRWLSLSRNAVTTVIGSGVAGSTNGFPPTSKVLRPSTPFLLSDGTLYTLDAELGGGSLGVARCVPCPASFYCVSGGPVICPIGSYCPFSSLNPMPSPPGTYSPFPGASSPTPCFPGTYNPLPGQAFCLQCEPGYFCPPNATTMTPCGINNFCPRGSSTPTPCPVFMAVDAALGPANGPAYEIDTAACLAHCYSGGPGQTSTCG